MKKKIRKAVFPVAGLGTRFLPATKASPKEMLPVVDKPLIQYAVEEAVAADIKVMVFITGRNKRAIEDHYDKAYELENELKQRGKRETLQFVQNIVPPDVDFVYIRQPEALGLGHAVSCARAVVGNEPFAVVLADDLIENGWRGCLTQMVELFEEQQCSILGCERVDPAQTGSYGIVQPRAVRDRLDVVEAIVEKPRPEEAPSNLAVVGRYILTPAIFDEIDLAARGAGGEIQLTDGIARLLAHERVLAYQFEGRRYDCGSKLGYLRATVEHALMHPELKEDFRAYLRGLAL